MSAQPRSYVVVVAPCLSSTPERPRFIAFVEHHGVQPAGEGATELEAACDALQRFRVEQEGKG